MGEKLERMLRGIGAGIAVVAGSLPIVLSARLSYGMLQNDASARRIAEKVSMAEHLSNSPYGGVKYRGL